MSKIPLVLFVLTSLIAAALLFCLVRGEPPAGHGVPHPRHAEMNQGGGPERHTDLHLVGGLYGGLQIALLVTGLCLGIRRDRARLWPLVWSGVCYLVLFAAVVGTYFRWGASPPRVLAFPLPTALMVYGMWGLPMIFVILYVVHFRDWVYTDADARRFAALTDRSSRERGDRDG